MKQSQRATNLTVRMMCIAACLGLIVSSVLWGNSLARIPGLASILSPAGSGTIKATPNPIQVCDGTGLGSTTLQWSSSGATRVEIHLGSPAGALVASGLSGSFTTSKSATNGTIFYLQD